MSNNPLLLAESAGGGCRCQELNAIRFLPDWVGIKVDPGRFSTQNPLISFVQSIKRTNASGFAL